VERDAFIAHAQQLSDAFMHVMKAPYLRLRFDAISHNACNRFHVDAMTARLICTCRGAGTQYGLSNAEGDPETVHTVPTGTAIVLRGKRWPPKAKVDLVHRSPPIQGTGQTRLVLVLDPIADLDEGV
jgi:O-acetyl-ADP-ribose deacetylase (regulator of RNase III)